MGAEMKTVLSLDSKDYKKSLQSAVNETKKYQKQVDVTQKELDDLAHEGGVVQEVFQKYGKQIGLNNEQMLKYGKSVGAAIKTLGLVGAAVGVAIAAFKGYEAIVSSCQDSLDDFQSKLEETKNIKDGFFIALNEGNVSGFLDNIGRIVKASKIAYNEMIKLRDLKLFMDPEIARIKSEQEYHAMKMDDQSLSEEERRFHQAEKEKGDKRINEIISSYRDSSMASFLSAFRLEASKKGYDANQWTDEEIINRTNYAEALTNEKNKKTRYETADYPREIPSFWEGVWKLIGHYNFSDALDKVPEEVANNPDYQFADVMASVKTEDWEKMLGYMTAYYTAEEELRGREHTTLMEKQGLNNEFLSLYGNNNTKNDEVDETTKQAINDGIKFLSLTNSFLNVIGKTMNKELSENELKNIITLQKKLDNSITSKKPNAEQIESNKQELDNYLKKNFAVSPIEIQVGHIKLDSEKSLKELEHDRDLLVQQMNNSKTGEEYIKIKARVDAKNIQIENFKAGRDANLPDMSAEIKKATEYNTTFNDSIEDTQKKAEKSWKEMQERAAAYSDAISNISNVFAQLGNVIGGVSGEWLSFTGVVLQGIADILPQIAKLVGGKFAEAMASGTASAAAMPFPANLAAIASITATIIGIFAALPSFASGGVFQGATSMGDYNLARVNGGEMILNQGQQGRLFRLLNEGGAIHNNNYVERDWVIRGSDLVGVVKNYGKIQNKIGKKIF